ncbi:hypothetical protein [Streptacidiphilus neutrinimicus]|uniref:hypothetical protein n=1 Tax=Streptacidiphilus neutrinimicus TaxID=105420 RepID=UPI0005AA9223|nr:hypothetical protein [Streptacidiphilus neutrinimicus]
MPCGIGGGADWIGSGADGSTGVVGTAHARVHASSGPTQFSAGALAIMGVKGVNPDGRGATSWPGAAPPGAPGPYGADGP